MLVFFFEISIVIKKSLIIFRENIKNFYYKTTSNLASWSRYLCLFLIQNKNCKKKSVTGFYRSYYSLYARVMTRNLRVNQIWPVGGAGVPRICRCFYIIHVTLVRGFRVDRDALAWWADIKLRRTEGIIRHRNIQGCFSVNIINVFLLSKQILQHCMIV